VPVPAFVNFARDYGGAFIPGKIVQNLKDLFAGRWRFCGIRAFIQCIHDNVNWLISSEFDHVTQTMRGCRLTGLCPPIMKSRIKFEKNTPTTVRAITELDEER
jgi:hypothetical protein